MNQTMLAIVRVAEEAKMESIVESSLYNTKIHIGLAVSSTVMFGRWSQHNFGIFLGTGKVIQWLRSFMKDLVYGKMDTRFANTDCFIKSRSYLQIQLQKNSPVMSILYSIMYLTIKLTL